jgi:hypothetical protein
LAKLVDAPVFKTGTLAGVWVRVPQAARIVPVSKELPMARTRDMKRLLEERDRLLREAEALDQKIDGLNLAISVLEREDDQPDRRASGRGKTKELLVTLLKEAGATGLNANSAVEMAARRGIALARGTAASTLSRLKQNGVANYDGERYRLALAMVERLARADSR